VINEKLHDLSIYFIDIQLIAPNKFVLETCFYSPNPYMFATANYSLKNRQMQTDHRLSDYFQANTIFLKVVILPTFVYLCIVL